MASCLCSCPVMALPPNSSMPVSVSFLQLLNSPIHQLAKLRLEKCGSWLENLYLA